MNNRPMIDVHLVRPEEFSEAGRVTALAWSHIPPNEEMGKFLSRVADVAGRAETTSVFIAAIDGQMVGTVTLELESRVLDPDNPAPLASGECHVRMLGVNPIAQRKGIARALMVRCIEDAREAGKTVMSLNTSDQNGAAQGLYESMGFRRDPDVISAYGAKLRAYRLDL
jgi:ribosomal protein S18 acetylase RimI-like enzyme